MIQKQKLTLRYLTALLLIACVLTFSYLTLLNQMKLNEEDGYIINISGMQRMLSQRISLLTQEVYNAEIATEAEVAASKLDEALATMISNHGELTSGQLLNGKSYVLSEEIKALYFAPNGVDEKVKNYTDM